MRDKCPGQNVILFVCHQSPPPPPTHPHFRNPGAATEHTVLEPVQWCTLARIFRVEGWEGGGGGGGGGEVSLFVGHKFSCVHFGSY